MPDVIADAFKALGPVGQALLAPVNLVGDALDKIPLVGPYIAPTALTLAGQPELAAAYQGIHTGSKTGSPLSGLLSAVGTYAGNSIGSSLGNSIGNSIGGTLAETPANALGDAFGGSTVGSFAPLGSFAGNALGSSTIGTMLGGALGSQTGQNIAQSVNPQSPDLGGTGTPGFSPSMQPQMGLPQSLSQFGSLNPNQQATNIATKGVYGGGQGPDETNYFLNLMNRQLFDQSGNVNGNTSNIAPVDMSFLNQLGISGSSPTDLLKGINQYGHA